MQAVWGYWRHFRSLQTGSELLGTAEDDHLIIEACGDKCIQYLAPTLDNKRLDFLFEKRMHQLVGSLTTEMQPMVGHICQSSSTIKHDWLRLVATKEACCQLRTVVEIGL